ncbi:hypothetical protein F5050DRAFT_1794661 [Lentinula boryana]|uniref:Uncharacterized protein n=1 Tax=Lentinula boryana TaxID=40481 RepID=A0ABQ8PYK1_9AGAR|nr:hypothetical protein F5050DRAFT_1794661 [Lentinula boryana]
MYGLLFANKCRNGAFGEIFDFRGVDFRSPVSHSTLQLSLQLDLNGICMFFCSVLSYLIRNLGYHCSVMGYQTRMLLRFQRRLWSAHILLNSSAVASNLIFMQFICFCSAP